MKTTTYLLALATAAATLLSGCGQRAATTALLDAADSLLYDNADSTLRLLDAHAADTRSWSKAHRMRYQLLLHDAMNKSDRPFTSDSAMVAVVRYYDGWGHTANERMRAHYLLGCVYRDLGETPHAIECYQDAAALADTTREDCDYRVLGRVYSQMAWLYHQQLLLSYGLKAHQQARACFIRSNETTPAIYQLSEIAMCHILMNKPDSAQLELQEAMRLYEAEGDVQSELQTSITLIYLYVEILGKTDEAKPLIDRYDRESALFDAQHELPPSRRQYYYYKGKYYENIARLDSAEYYYRKVAAPNMSFVAQDPMYSGLLSVYKKRHQADSIAKYAQLYCMANDSSIAIKDQQQTALLTASYDYSYFQTESMRNEQRALMTLLLSTIVFGVLIIAALVILWLWLRYRARQKEKLLQMYRAHEQKTLEIERLKTEFISKSEAYKMNLHSLQLLETSHKALIAQIQDELKREQKESGAYRAKYSQLQQKMDEANAQYELSKTELDEENKQLKQQIEELKGQEGLSKYIEESKLFAETDIVKHVMHVASKPTLKMSEHDWDTLLKTASEYYPLLYRDLNHMAGKTPQKIRACILMTLQLRTSDMANLLEVSSERVSNMKSELNMALFNNPSARSLSTNLAQRYNIYST